MAIKHVVTRGYALGEGVIGWVVTRGYTSLSASALQVCHETRKALESVVSGLATVAVSYPNRPFAMPSSGPWYRVYTRWDAGEALSIGASSRLGGIQGRFVIEVWQRQGQGMGTLNDHADALRDAFNRLEPSVPSGMRVQVFVPSGPQPVSDTGVTGVRLSLPFEVVETITV